MWLHIVFFPHLCPIFQSIFSLFPYPYEKTGNRGIEKLVSFLGKYYMRKEKETFTDVLKIEPMWTIIGSNFLKKGNKSISKIPKLLGNTA